MPTTIKERIADLQKQLDYWKSVNDAEKISVFAAVINELIFWQSIYEPD